MHYYKRNIGDYAKKAGKLSMLQHGSYTLLIDACYDRERFPTMEEALDWCWATTPEEIDAVKFVLAKFFTIEDGRYTQARILDEITAYHGKCKTNKGIALEREEAKRARNENETSTNRAQDVNESTPNQEPRTSNQEPLTNTSLSEPAGSNCPHLKIVELYNTILADHGLPTRINAKLWAGSSRQSALSARWKEDTGRQSLEWWERFFAYVSKSDFLMGRTAQPFTIDAGWLFKKDNFIKVMEGKYHG